jgi:hypothetical protein
MYKKVSDMDIFLLWLGLSILVAVFANSRGKSGILYFLLAVLLSPLLGFLIAFVTGDKTKKKCFNCGQNIDINAKVCPFCNIDMKDSNSIKKDSKIIKVNDSLSKLVLDKEATPYTMNDLKKIVKDNYDEKYRAEVSVDNDSLFSIKGRAGEFGTNYIQIESKENEFVIQSYNMIIPSELEAKEAAINENCISNISKVDKLIELGKLYKDGLLTKEEFEEQKNILNGK